MYHDFFNRHEPGKVALQLSFGKDSAACLELMKPWWDRLVVVWCNPGNPIPAAVEYMEKVAAKVPNFTIVLGQQRNWIAQNGHPSDILPIEGTELGRIAANSRSLKLSFVGDCCAANLWLPMAEYVKANAFTGVIRGQKLSDNLRAPVRSGDEINGVEYLFPIEHWADEDVIKFLGDGIPSTYLEGVEHSIDCANCTAYSRNRKGVQAYLDRHLPAVGEEVRRVRTQIAILATTHVKMLKEV